MEIFDKESALDRVDGDREFLLELYDIAIEDSSVRIKKIEDSIHSNDPKKLSSEAHALKSAMGNIGAMTCHALCYNLEKIGKSNSVENASTELDNLKNQIELFKAEIQKFKDS